MWANIGFLELLRRLGLSLAVAASGILIGFLMWPKPEAHAAGPASVEVAGLPVDRNGDLTTLARLLAHRYLSAPLTLRADDVALHTSRAQLGVKVDLGHLTLMLGAAGDARSVMRRVHEHYRKGQPLRMPMPIGIEEERAMPWLARLKDAVDRKAVDAQVNPRTQEVIPAVPGRQLDLFASLEALERAVRAGQSEVSAIVKTQKPKRDVSALEHIEMGTVLADFQTPYSLHQKAKDRTHNLKVAAAALDGLVIRPNEVFDFNEAVGDRTRTNGFKMAPVISYGQLVDGMGGGTCQIASTLHGAVLFAGLPILTRSPHSRPSYYIKLGLDAAVAYGSLNFRFKNDRDYPIVLSMTVEDGQVKAAIHGAEQDRGVTFVRRIDAAIPFDEKLVDDDTLPRGLRVLSQRGVPGFEVTRFRTVHNLKTGQSVRERSSDTYPATTQIWRVGTGPEAPEGQAEPLSNDSHPEYVADEYLKALWMPGQSELEVTRSPGRYGTYGWTEREGMLKPAS